MTDDEEEGMTEDLTLTSIKARIVELRRQREKLDIVLEELERIVKIHAEGVPRS